MAAINLLSKIAHEKIPTVILEIQEIYCIVRIITQKYMK